MNRESNDAREVRGSYGPDTKVNEGDAWADLSTYACSTCRFFVPKDADKGRCRRHAPTMDGYPVVYPHDWCGDHKLGTNPSRV